MIPTSTDAEGLDHGLRHSGELPPAGRCQVTPDCTGVILDGYCTDCGRVAGPAPATVATPQTRKDGSTSPGQRSAERERDSRSSAGQSRPSTPSRTPTVRLRPGSRLGAGLVDVPPVGEVDPSSAVMEVPEVPEARRFCFRCGAEVGRSKDGRPGRLAGFCGKCRHQYSFVPSLERDELVINQYRIVGCLAYGGLGWVYLARDEQVSNRWVVLKGLLNVQDPAAMAAALAERQFLARVQHPNVVRIYNFVEHGGAGYIVMEYVGGKTLRDVLKERREASGGRADPLPVELGIAYILGILPAFRYLHALGLAYNDFKPDNVMLQGDDVKLIDLGAVTRLDDSEAVVYGTDGYQAPEVATRGPSVASDLYAIARCLTVLLLDFRGYQTTYRFKLPGRDTQPLFQRYESLHRFLLKGTTKRPEDRFQSAEEMEEQLFGVLREVVAVGHGMPAPAASTLYGRDQQPLRAAAVGEPDWRHLPAVRVDPADPASSFVASVMLQAAPAQQVAMLSSAIEQGQVQTTVEVELAMARAMIELGDTDGAEACLDRALAAAPYDWREAWYRGVSLLAQGRPAEAQPAFDRVFSALPGELAPKLALALAAELVGDVENAARLYGVVVATDPDFTSACFGLARMREAQGDRTGAAAAYAAIPPTSSMHVPAQQALARVLMGRGRRPATPTVDELVRASATIQKVPLDSGQRAMLAAELLETALELLETRRAPPQRDAVLLGLPLEELPVREGLERAYRDLARLASGDEKVRLVDRANQVRPMTAV